MSSDLPHPHEPRLRTISTPTEHFDVDAVGPGSCSFKEYRQTDGPMANATNDWETRRTKIHWKIYKNVTLDDIFKEKWNLCLQEMIHGYSRPSNIRNLCVLLR